jgi:hypothetical protein
LIVAGDSAGAQLALQVGPREPDVAAVLAFEAPNNPLVPDWPRATTEGTHGALDLKRPDLREVIQDFLATR